MIVVTTPTGNIGSLVVQHLLAANQDVTVIARDPARLAADIQSRVTVIQGSSDDENIMMRALNGAESLFLVVPPSFTTTDDVEHYLQFTRPACRAIHAHGVKRVVSVSGMGRGISMKAGPVTAAFAKDEEIEKSGVAFRALWCPGFMENILTSLDTLKHQGAFYSPALPDHKAPHVATRDIAASGSRLLLNRAWTGQGGLAVLGPEDLSFNDMAFVMTEVLGTPIRYQQVPADAYKAQLMQFGASEHFAQGLLDMYSAKDNGLDNAEPRTEETSTPTSFRQWCEDFLRPAFLARQ